MSTSYKLNYDEILLISQCKVETNPPVGPMLGTSHSCTVKYRMMMCKYFVVYCREEQSLVEEEQREELEEPTIEDPGKNYSKYYFF